MELGNEIFRTRGRAAKVVSASIVRELEQSDLVLLSAEKGSKPCHIKRLSDRHHSLARALSRGVSPSQAAIECGYSLSRVSILQDDPAFKELLQFYRADQDATFRGLDTKLAGLAHDALDELQERLETEPEKVSIGQLQEIIKMGADRTGFGPQTSSTNVNVNVDLASRLEAARRRVDAVKLKLIEGDKGAIHD